MKQNQSFIKNYFLVAASLTLLSACGGSMTDMMEDPLGDPPNEISGEDVPEAVPSWESDSEQNDGEPVQDHQEESMSPLAQETQNQDPTHIATTDGSPIEVDQSEFEKDVLLDEAPNIMDQEDGFTLTSAFFGIELSTPHTYPLGEDLQPVVWRETIVHEGAEGLRVYFGRFDIEQGSGSDPFGNDYVAILNGDGEVVARYTGKMPFFWSDYVAGDTLTIEVHSDPDQAAYGFDIRHYQAYFTMLAAEGEPDPADLATIIEESIYLADDFIDMASFNQTGDVYTNGQAVARIRMAGGGSCTGFLFDNNLLMTNNHCLSTQNQCRNDSVTTRAQFNYENNPDGTTPTLDIFDCDALLETDWGLDYSILSLVGDPGDTYGTLNLQDADPARGDNLVIIGHPAARRKQVSLNDCRVVAVPVNGRGLDTDLSHQCDTLGGSSGSPVMDSTSFNVVGLHHFGGANTTNANSFNRAVRMHRILDTCSNCVVTPPPPPPDTDGDGVADPDDNCPDIPNSDQSDVDGDGRGDACDNVDNRIVAITIIQSLLLEDDQTSGNGSPGSSDDVDGDGVTNDVDNCVSITNPSQSDADLDGVGDACDEETLVSFSSDELVFETLNGFNQYRFITIKNLSSQTIHISSVTTSDPHFYPWFWSTRTIQPDRTTRLWVSFSSSAQGTSFGELTIQTDIPGREEVTINLEGVRL